MGAWKRHDGAALGAGGMDDLGGGLMGARIEALASAAALLHRMHLCDGGEGEGGVSVEERMALLDGARGAGVPGAVVDRRGGG